MGEYKTLAVLVAVLTALNMVAILLLDAAMKPNGPVTADYTAVLRSNGLLEETYRFHVYVSGKYHMLYRFWRAPLVPRGAPPPGKPYVAVLRVSCPRGFIPYLKDYRGVVHTTNNMYAGYIAEKAYVNEVGCLNPSGIREGVYTLRVDYIIHPPLQVDGEGHARLELKLADEHIPYSRVEVVFEGFKPLRVYVHTPFYRVEEEPGRVIVDTYSPKDMLLEVDMLYEASSARLPAYRVIHVKGLPRLFEEQNKPYIEAYRAVEAVYYALTGLAAAFPVIAIVLYLLIGREKSYVVPKYLSYVPNPERKPWEVNLLFKGDAMKMDHDAFYATILDLARRGVVKLREEGDDIVVELPEHEPQGLDSYESRVLSFLREWSSGRVFSFREASRRIREAARNRSEALRIRAEMAEILHTPPEAKEYARLFLVTRKWWFAAAAVAVLLALLAYVFIPVRLPGMKTPGSLAEAGLYAPYAQLIPGPLIVLFIDLVICSLTPSQLYGRWRGDYYREKLMWDSFRRLLSDLAMIEKYKPSDLSMWQDWLVYGTALGVGKKVVEAMKRLHAPYVPGAAVVYVGPRTIGSAYAYVSRASGSGGAGGGGGFGVGGGFGGGGAGAR